MQEIRKLADADLPSPITAEALASQLEDSAHYDTFDLIDGALAGDARRVSRMVRALRQEGVAPFAVLGALAAQVRRIASGGYVPGPRQRLVKDFVARIGSPEALERVLAECALVDAQGKGQMPGDAWLSLEDLLLRLCGARPLLAGSPARLLR